MDENAHPGTPNGEAGPGPARPESGLHLVAGVGASAGGLEALERFFEPMPEGSGIAFVVVQHLSPDYKSLMVELLSKRTRMPVLRAEDGMLVEPGKIYLNPPKKNMTVFHGRLLLSDQDHSHGLNLPIDVFLRSLAEDAGDRAIAVILSGTGSDGMRGVRAVKESGGMVMAQAPETAKFDGMPRSAISTGLCDFVLPAEEMPGELLRFAHRPPSPAVEAKPLAGDEDVLAKIIALLRHQTGVDFAYYKPSTIVRRIERRMNINRVESIEDYLRYVRDSPREVGTLYKELLIGVTNFFRDPEGWEVLRQHVVPEVLRSAGPGGSVRAWVAACSTGEEAYSLAMLFAEGMDAVGLRCDVKVFATDIDKDAIEYAGAGVYPESIAADLAPERLARFFVRVGDRYQVSRSLRETVVFATQNLAKDPPFTRMDVVTCRNLLIYFQAPLQKKVLSLFSFALRPQGFLFLGTSEALGDLHDQFVPVDTKWKVYRSQASVRPSLAEALSFAAPPESRLRMRLHSGAGTARSIEVERINERLWDSVAGLYVPPGLVVTEDGEPIQVFGDVSRFFRIPPGRASFNALKMATSDLALVLPTAFHRAVKERAEIVFRDVRIDDGSSPGVVCLRVRPVPGQKDAERLFGIFLEEQREAQSPEPAGEAVTFDEQTRRRITDLEQELLFTKENLQATVEELETSNEELQATNEELLASNEELQSTNEELQSVNEELYTVNAEYQNKIVELVDLNNDMENFLLVTRVGVLFVDRDLNIRKFTPAVARELNLLPQDVGRPLAHLAPRLRYETLAADARRVLADLVPLEREARNEHGTLFLVRIVPYRVEGNHVRGAVITLVDATAGRAARGEGGGAEREPAAEAVG